MSSEPIPSSASPSLDLITTDDLLSELLTRFNCVILAGFREESMPDAPRQCRLEFMRSKGEVHHVLGMLARMSHRVNADYEQRVVETDEL